MNRKTEEWISRVVLGGGAIASLMIAYSIWKPGGGWSSVPQRRTQGYGAPKAVKSDFDEKITKFTHGQFYEASTDYQDISDYTLVKPTEVGRRERDPETGNNVFVVRKGSDISHVVAEVGKEYILQLNCPENMKSVDVVYADQILGTSIGPSTDGFVLTKTMFTALQNPNKIQVQVVYDNGEFDSLEILVEGRK
jgi:hypothetical protein